MTFYRANRAVFFLKIETNFGKKHLRYLGSQIILWEVPPLQFYYVVILSYADDVCAYVILSAIPSIRELATLHKLAKTQ